jgi:glycosyltransferase involved in cell wall biosynthesis
MTGKTGKGRGPLVSVIIPAHNEELVIARAIRAVLANKYPRKEIIVVSDDSTDRTAEIAAGFGKQVRVISVGKRCASGARNAGAKIAKGEVLAFVDADQMMAPAYLAAVARGYASGARLMGVRRVKKAEGGGLVARYFAKLWGAMPDRKISYEAEGRPDLRRLPSYAFVFDRKLFEKMGGYDERIFYFEDGDITIRALALEGKMLYDPAVLEYSIDPATYSDVFLQSKNSGRGVVSMVRAGKMGLFDLAKPFYYLALALSPLLLLAWWPAFVVAVLVHLLVCRREFRKAGLLDGLGFAFIIRPIRGLGMLYGIIANMDKIL